MTKIIINLSYIKKILINPYLHILLLLGGIFYMLHSMAQIEIVKKEISETIYENQEHVYFLDAGHGYINEKCDHKALFVEDGDSCFYEYKFNNAVVNKIAQKLDKRGIFYIRTDKKTLKRDMPLSIRTNKINRVFYKLKKINEKACPVLFSIHANASSSNPDARGIELYANIEKGDRLFTNSDYFKKGQKYLTELFCDNLKAQIPDQKYREGKNGCFKISSRAYEGDIYILKHSKAYAILLESGFYTNDEDRRLLSSDEYQEKIANAVYHTICTIEDINPN